MKLFVIGVYRILCHWKCFWFKSMAFSKGRKVLTSGWRCSECWKMWMLLYRKTHKSVLKIQAPSRVFYSVCTFICSYVGMCFWQLCHVEVQIWCVVTAEAHTVFPCMMSDRHTCCCPAPSGFKLSLSWISYDLDHLCKNCWGQTGSVAYALWTSYCISLWFSQ